MRAILYVTGGYRNARNEDLEKLHSSPNGPMIDHSGQVKKLVKENIPILYKPKFHYSVHRGPQLDAILSRTGPFETFTASFPRIIFKIICSCRLSFQK